MGWIDVFSRENYREILVNSLRYCIREKGLKIYAYVIMTNHAHLIANTVELFQLRDTIRDFKKFTAKACVEQIASNGESRKDWMLKLLAEYAAKSPRHKDYRFWQSGNHAIELYNPKFTWTKINYIHNNPVKAGFVKKPEDWLYSSISNYVGMVSKIPEVVTIPPLINFKG